MGVGAEQEKTILFKDVESGETFIYNDDIYMKINLYESLNLNNHMMYVNIKDNDEVEVVLNKVDMK